MAQAVGGARWPAKAGAWLGLGTSPAALVYGASMGARYDGPVPAVSILVGTAIMATILYYQGVIGLRPPVGEGRAMSDAARSYFGPVSNLGLNIAIVLGMVGWLGFGTGLGGAALGELLHIPDWSGSVILGGVIVLASWDGMVRWNWIAVVTTVTSLALVGIVLHRLAAPVIPLQGGVPGYSNGLLDMAGFVGYVAVFGVRAPDFTVGLRGRRDLWWCIGLLVIPIMAVTLAGVMLQRGTQTTDLVGALAGPRGLPIANALVALSLFAPSLTGLHSGALAARGATGISPRNALVPLGVVATIMGALRFDLALVGFLTFLAAALPPLLVPMAFEAARRRRGATPRKLPMWTWLPAAIVALALTVAAQPYGALTGVAVSGTMVGLWSRRLRRAPGRLDPDRGEGADSDGPHRSPP